MLPRVDLAESLRARGKKQATKVFVNACARRGLRDLIGLECHPTGFNIITADKIEVWDQFWVDKFVAECYVYSLKTEAALHGKNPIYKALESVKNRPEQRDAALNLGLLSWVTL